jgi:anti-sigma factor RsiW
MRLRRRNKPEPEMTCRELVELVTDYLEMRLAPGDLERFEAHLELCDPCVTYIEQIRQSVAVVGTLSEETLPQGAVDALLAEFHDWKRARG